MLPGQTKSSNSTLGRKGFYFGWIIRLSKEPIANCAVAAMRAGYSVFAVQNGGWCAASATAAETFNKYGKSAACKSDGEGGPWANQVYVINGKTLSRCRPSVT